MSGSNLRSYGSKFTVLKKVVGTFRRFRQSFGDPIAIRRPGNCSPLSSLVTPLVGTHHEKLSSKDFVVVDSVLSKKSLH